MPNDKPPIGAEIPLYNGWKFKKLLSLQGLFHRKKSRDSENGIE